MAGEDPCAYVALTDYNLGLHIGSVFILLGVSLAGAMLPVVLHISSRSSAVLAAVKMGTYFGAPRACLGARLGGVHAWGRACTAPRLSRHMRLERRPRARAPRKLTPGPHSPPRPHPAVPAPPPPQALAPSCPPPSST